MATERVTISFPPELVRSIDRLERNRSKFIQEAVQRELEHRRRLELERSLRNPHPETLPTAELGLEVWGAGLGDPPGDDLLDPAAGTQVAWVPGEGWRERLK